MFPGGTLLFLCGNIAFFRGKHCRLLPEESGLTLGLYQLLGGLGRKHVGRDGFLYGLP